MASQAQCLDAWDLKVPKLPAPNPDKGKTVSSLGALKDAIKKPGQYYVDGFSVGDVDLKMADKVCLQLGPEMRFRKTNIFLGSHSIWDGGRFNDGIIQIEGGHSLAQNFLMENGAPGGNRSKRRCAIQFVGNASHSMFANYEIRKWGRRAACVFNPTDKTKNNWFVYGQIHDWVGQKANSGEWFQCGHGHHDPKIENTETVFIFNQIWNYTGDAEGASLKAGGAFVGYNQITNCKNWVQSRTGPNSRIVYNRFDRCGTQAGIKALSRNTRVVGNNMGRSVIIAGAGNATWKEITTDPKKFKGLHPTLEDGIIAYNTNGTLKIGQRLKGRQEAASQYYGRTIAPTAVIWQNKMDEKRTGKHQGIFKKQVTSATCPMPSFSPGIGKSGPLFSGTPSLPPLPTPQPTTDTPKNEIAIVSATGGPTTEKKNPAQNVLDNKRSTRWSAKGKGSKLDLVLKGLVDIESVGIAWFKGSYRRASFAIHSSVDGREYTLLNTCESSGSTDAVEQYPLLQPKQARYLRIVGDGNTQNDWTSITKVKVYGQPNSAPADSGIVIGSIVVTEIDGDTFRVKIVEKV